MKLKFTVFALTEAIESGCCSDVTSGQFVVSSSFVVLLYICDVAVDETFLLTPHMRAISS